MATQNSFAPARFVPTTSALAIQEALALAGACLQAGDLARAEQLCRRVLALDHASAQAWFVLGVVCQLSDKAGDSVDCYCNSLHLMSSNAEAWNNLGVSLQSQRRPEEAAPCFREALLLEPGYAQAHNNLGNALQAMGMLEEAAACYHRALHHKPDYPSAYDHLGLLLQAQGQLEEAVKCHDHAIRLAPSFAEPHLHRAMAWLQMGDFTQGWKEYEWRSRCLAGGIRSFDQPVWDGAPLEGRTILLHAEQGLGDAIQFIRYAPLVKQRGGQVIVACQQPLARIVASGQGVDRVIADGAPLPAFDCHAPLLSLPRIFETRLEMVPAEIPYLAADPVLVDQWSAQLARFPLGLSAGEGIRQSTPPTPPSQRGERGWPATLFSPPGQGGVRGGDRGYATGPKIVSSPTGVFNIGVAWQGSPDHKKDRQRSFRLSEFEPLSRVPGARLFSLQKGFGAEQLTDGSCRFPIGALGGRLDDLMDTAAAIKALDLIITPDTALAHLAGALGASVWVALPFAADWRWLLGRDDSPWYPTMRLYRQARWGGWREVFERMASQLDADLNGDQYLRTNPLGPST